MQNRFRTLVRISIEVLLPNRFPWPHMEPSRNIHFVESNIHCEFPKKFNIGRACARRVRPGVAFAPGSRRTRSRLSPGRVRPRVAFASGSRSPPDCIGAGRVRPRAAGQVAFTPGSRLPLGARALYPDQKLHPARHYTQMDTTPNDTTPNRTLHPADTTPYRTLHPTDTNLQVDTTPSGHDTQRAITPSQLLHPAAITLRSAPTHPWAALNERNQNENCTNRAHGSKDSEGVRER